MDYNKEYAKKVYAGLKKRGYTDADLGDEELFVTRMGREENRRYLYDLVTERGDANIGSWARFNSRMTEQPTVEPDGVIQYLENLSGIPYPQKKVDKSQYTFTGAELGIEPKPAVTGKGVRGLDLSDVERPYTQKREYGQTFDEAVENVEKFHRMRYGDGGTLVAPGVYKDGDVYRTAGGTAKKLTNANYKAYKAQVESDITDMMALYEQIGATPYGRLDTSEWGNYVNAMELGSEGRSRGERRLQEWRNRAGEQTFFLEGKELPRERTIPKPKGYSAALRLLPLLSLPEEEGKKILGEEGYNALKFFKAQNERFAQFNNEAEEDAARLTPIETFYQSAESMGRGVEGFTGEALNLLSGSSLDDKFIIDNWDYFMELRKQVEKDPGSAIPEKDVDRFEYISELVKETGSIEAAKAEIKRRSEDVSVGDRLRMDASDAIDSFNPTAEGFGGFVAEMAPQMIGVIGSLIAGGAGAPLLAAGIGYANMGYLTASEMGHAMKEARDAGATNLDVWLTGIANGAVELITEKLPFDYLTRGILRTGKGKIAKELVKQMAENPAAREEMEELLIRAGKEMNEPLLSGRNIKKYVANVAAEGASEFTAEALQTMTTMIYENPEDYPTLTEILKNGVEGLKGGLFMGAVNAGIANPMERRANDERRKRQGYVQVARVEVDGSSYIGEILGEKESGELVVLVAGKEKTVTKDNIKDIVVFEYNDFHNGVLEGEINAAYEEAFNEEPSGAAASSSARGLNDAENAARVALGVANGVTIEEYMDGKTIEQVAMGDDSVREALENYFKAKADFDGRRQRFQEMLQKAYDASDKAIDAHINKRNPAMVYSTMYDGHKVYITDGDVVLNEDGTIDYNNSSELYITYPDGHVEQVSANKIIGKITAGNTEELKAQARAQIDQNWKNEFDAAEISAAEQEKRKKGLLFNLTDGVGDHTIEVLEEGADDSKILFDGKEMPISTDELNQWRQEAGVQREVAPVQSSAPAVAPIPIEKRGKEERAAYHLAPIERTLEDLHDGALEPNEITALINARIKEAYNDVQALEKKKPTEPKKPVMGASKEAYLIAKAQVKADFERAQSEWQTSMDEAQQRLNYYNELYAREQEITKSETREAYDNVQPREVVEITADEFIANNLPKITPESFKAETGLSNSEQAELVGYIAGADKGGVSVERAAEIIMESYGDELRGLGFQGDMQDVRDIIIDILSQGNPRSYAKSGIEQRRKDSISQQRAEMESVAASLGFESVEEWAAYEEQVIPGIIQMYTGFDYNEYYNNLAENYEYDTTREGETVGRGGELLQGEQPVDNTGAPVAEGNERGAVPDSVQSDGTNAQASGNQQVNKPVGNSEQLSSSEIPNNQSVAGLEGYSTSEILDLVKGHIFEALGENVRIVDMRIIGSRTNGTNNADSDLDVLVEYEGDISEDSFFNVVNDGEGALYIDGIRVDINPITKDKSGSIEQWMNRNKGYSKAEGDAPGQSGVEELQDARAFAEAYSLNTVEAYQAYLDRFPEGAYRDGARNGIWTLEGTEEANSEAIERAMNVIAQAPSGVYADNQGNPVDADGKLIVDEVNSIDEITDEDFETPTRNVQLPAIPENVANAIGTEGRPVVIKKNVFAKNGETHVELEPEDSRDILRSALYNPNIVGSTQPVKRPDYKVAIRTGEKNAVVVLDVYREKDYVEIVGWRMVNEKGLAKMQRQAEREGGQFLILSPNDGAAAALSALPFGLSSASEDRNSVSNSQENAQKSGETAENGGEITETTTEQTENENLQTEATQESVQVVESPAEASYDGPVNMETLQLNMSEEDFNALLSSGDKAAISEYLAEMDGLLRIGVGSPLDGRDAIMKEYRGLVEQYGGEENIPAEVMDDLNSRMQPYSDLSRAVFDRKYALQDRLREIEATEQRAKELAEKETKAEHKQTAFGGFLAGKTDLGASAAEKALNKKYDFDGKVMTVAEFVEEAVDNGDAKLSTIEEPKYKGASRAAWNRMDARQQEADAKRVKESGTKTIYTVNDHDLGKTAYDYAKFLLDKKAEQEKAAAKQMVKNLIQPFAKEQTAVKIEDVGEKIGGARKDRFAEGMARIKADLEETDETLMDKLAKLPVSQVFNFDLEKLREGGISNDAISFIKIVKDYLPAKPRKTYKIRSWVNNTLALYKLCLEAGTNWDRVNTLLNGPQFASSSLKEQFDAYMAIGGFDSGMNIGDAKLRQLDKTSGGYDKSGKFVTLAGKWYVKDAGKHGGIYDTKEEAVNALKAFAGDKAGVTSSGKKKEVKFAVYQRRQDKSIFIAVKGKSDIVIQDGFASSKEAFDYIEANNAELQERYRALLDKTNADFEDNRPREGRDYRDGKDIPAEEFRTTFGFRGVEFGNWMTQEDRRKALNECYDALMDLAAVCKVSPQALSLGGTLGMAFGARGGGRFSAHYEPGKLVINLTKTKGAGSLAHEWFHALDNYFAKMGSEGLDVYATAGEGLSPEGVRSIGKRYYDRNSSQMLTEEEYNERMNSHDVRREMADAWKSLMETLKKSDYYKRSLAYAGLHNSNYWSRPTELGARAFSTWVENELSKQGASNDYLANNPRFLVSEATDAQSRFMPYPFDADATWMEEAFGNLFEVMEEKTTEEGDVVLYRSSEDIEAEYPNWLEGTTTDSGKHSTQVEGTRKTYKKVGDWIEENMGKDVAILDASSGMGYGTADLRERGFDIEDVEPYQSEDRKQNNPATYSSYADIEKQYDYIISNAVLNVIPDNWRTDLLHEMVDKLKVGGKLFINTRKAGEERSIKDKIELDSPQEVLVKRNGKIASYQRFFTPTELKEWVESELGEGYSVKIANKANSGTNGLAAVVVTKNEQEVELDREGAGPLTDREVVMESDLYSKVLGKPRYYGKRQREFVARQRSRMAEKARQVAEKLNTPIEVRETAEGLTGKKAKAKGWYDVKSGNIVVVVSNHGSIEDIQATVLHEVVAHKGLRQMFGEHFDAFLDNVYNNVDAEIRAEIDALTEKYGNTREATEEYLASLAENTYFEKVNPSLWSRIKQWFLNMLTEAGIKLDFELSDNELRYILWRSHQRLVNPGIYNPVTRITDVAVRARLGIGEYAPAVEEMAHVAEEDVTPEMQESVMQGQTMFRMVSYDEAVQIADDFAKTHKGATKKVVFSKGAAEVERQMRDAGFAEVSIEAVLDDYTNDDISSAVYLKSSDGIVFYEYPTDDEVYSSLWHENTHRALRKLFGDDLTLAEDAFETIPQSHKEVIIAKLKARKYKPDEYAEEALCYFIQEMYEARLLGNETYDIAPLMEEIDPKMKDFAIFAQRLINYTRYGEDIKDEGSRGVDELAQWEDDTTLQEWNAESREEGAGTIEREEGAAEETRLGVTEQEIARNTATFLGEKLNTPVSVIEDSSTLPENRRDKKGWFDPKTGEVAVVMGNHISTEDVVETVLHEVVGHKGLRAVMGEKFDEFLDGVYRNGSSRVKRGITDVFYGAIKGGHALTVHEATEEYIAGLAERDFEGFEDTWNAIKQWFRDFFRNFMNMEVTDGELRYMLWKNYNRMKSGPIETIIDRAMEARTDTGDKGTMFRRAYTGGIGERYDRRVEGKWNKVKEGWYDATRSIRVAQEEIERESGKSISDSANIYDYANHVPSINRNKMERFDVNYIQPFLKFLKAVRKIKLSSGEKLNETVLGRYANAKHGIERNREMSVREALTEVVDGKPQFNKNAYEQYKIERDAIRKNGKKWLEQQNELDLLAGKYGATIRDYSGLTAIFNPEQKLKYSDIRKAAVDMVLEVEGKIDSKKFWEHIKGINGYSLKENYESGLMSLEDYKNVSGMYEYYVPLRGHKDIMAEDVYDYVEEKKSNLNGVVITTHGRITEADDIFATMLNMANSAIVFGSKNRMKQHLLNLCLMNQTPLLTLKSAWYQKEGGKYVPKYPNITEGMTAEQINAEHERFEQEMADLAEMGLAVRHRQGLNMEYALENTWAKNQHAVPVKRNGREYIIYVNGSPRLAQAVNGLLLSNDVDNWGLKAIDSINQWRAKAVTGYSPSFVLRNLSRDMQSASVVYYAMHGATQMRKFDATAIKLIPQIHKLYKLYKKGALNEENETHRYFKEFLENGGETGYTEMISIEDFQKKVKKYARGASIGDFGKKPFKAMADAAEFANRGVENVCRFAAYMTSRKAGMSILKSINDAKEVSVNFNRKGSGAYGQAEAKRLYMFLNPAIQAMVQRIELTKKYPKRMAKVWATEFAMGAAMPALWTLIYALCGGDEDEAWGNYYNKSNFSRRANITLPLGDGTINIPLAHESRTLYGLGEMLTSWMMGHTEYDNVGEELFNTLTQSLPLNPIEGWAPGDNIGETLKFNLYPDALKPLIEIEYNRDFAGNRIHNASDFNAHYPERERGKRGASSVFTFISELISGEYERNWVDDTFGEFITPSSLEHLAKSNLGGLYDLASELGKTAQWIAGNEEFAEFKNIPIINSFYSSLEKYESKPTEERTRRDWEKAFKFYAEEISGDHGTEKNYRRHIKDGDEEATPGYNAMIERGETLRIDIFNDGKEVLKELYDELNAARAAKNLKAVEDVDKRIYAQKRKMVEQMEQMGDDPMSGYLMLRGKTKGIYGEHETYGDYWDMNVINDFQTELKPLYEEYKGKRVDSDKQKVKDLWWYLEDIEDDISYTKKRMTPENADEKMAKIRELRAKAIKRINNYRKDE